MNEPIPRKTTVTLEDLLRLKRAEQPPAEFWAEFDRGLRAKQLAAIVEPRPWWAPFIRVGARMARHQLPVGATAILAITLLTVREYQPTTPSPTAYESTPAEMTTPTAPAVAMEQTSVADSISVPLASAMALANEPTSAPVAVDSRSTQPMASTSTTLGAISHVAMVGSELSSARYMADNLAAAHAADPELNQTLVQSLTGTENPSARTEPLAQISVPGESRRSRLLGGATWLTASTSGSSALRTDEQATRHLTERRLSESDVISRIDMDGSRLTVKF